jgi:nitrogen-specific signal transduction histidine kinase
MQYVATPTHARYLRGNAAYVMSSTAPDADDEVVTLRAQLRAVSEAIVRLHHEVNNPLAIISGNAQLLAEVGRAEGLSEDLMGPILDIEAATERLAESLRRLAALREEVDAFRR